MAASAPILLSEAKRRRGRGGKPPGGPAAAGEDVACPVTPLGHLDGKFYFLNAVGERRALSARQLGTRSELATGLFLGDVGWLLANFEARDKDGNPSGFSVNRASEHLATACRRNGIYGEHIVIRRPGVWAGEGGAPIAHCGDALFYHGQKHTAGVKIAGQIFGAGPREAYPAARPAEAMVARAIQGDICKLWDLRDEGAELIAVGLVGQAYLAAALSWRANGFISGASNAGKSQLLGLLRAMVPLCHYTTDTSKAGVEGAVNGKAMPSFIDETAERGDGYGGQLLLDVVLSASSGTGTKGHRGTADGGVRQIEMVGSVIMASITPPSMQPQHRSRFTLIELLKPQGGADNLAAMQAATARAAVAAPGLFARALAGFERYEAALAVFRKALGEGGCVAREMDQVGAILAGHWLLTEDDVPDALTAGETVKFISAFIRGADAMAQDDAPQRVLAMLLSKIVSLDRSTDQESLARLVEAALVPDWESTLNREQAVKVLERWGLRAIRADDALDKSNRPIPRGGQGDGVWIDPRVQPLRHVFEGSAYAGDRWLFELLRLPKSARSRATVRVTALGPCKAIWISWDEISKVDDTG